MARCSDETSFSDIGVSLQLGLALRIERVAELAGCSTLRLQLLLRIQQRLFRARLNSVMSGYVETKPPPAIGWPLMLKT